MPSVKITGIKQQNPIIEPLCNVDIDFEISGSFPNLVQIYAYQAGVIGPANYLSSVNISSSQTKYSCTIQLDVGNAFKITLCPRTIKNGVLDDNMDGEYWEALCVSESFTTKAPPGTGELDPMPTPTITGAQCMPQRIGHPNGINLSWDSSVSYQYFQVLWGYDGAPLADQSPIQIDVAGPTGAGSTSGSQLCEPTTPGVTYELQVQRCNSGGAGGNLVCSNWSIIKIKAMPNVNSLRAFLAASGVSGAGGVIAVVSQSPPISLRTLFGV